MVRSGLPRKVEIAVHNPVPRERRSGGTDMRSIVYALTMSTALAGLIAMPAPAGGKTACKKTASLAKKSCKLESYAEKRLEEGKCLQSRYGDVVSECLAEARDAAREELEECRARFPARLEVCGALEEDVYDPVLDPADFVETITNPFAPYAPGSHWAYEGMTEEGLERVEVDVLSDTRTILGIEATVVRDRVFLEGELVEDTVDWLAQDVGGNVWYLGEIAQNFEDGRLVDLDGSWETGEDGGKPGFWMKGYPEVGDVYRQEFLLREAEDIGEVLSLSEVVTVPVGTFTDCLQTRDSTPIEPDVFEHKFYAPGVGLLLEVNPETGEQLELVEFWLP
jgi:hypothetical protein